MNHVAGSEIKIAKKAVHADSIIGIYVAFCVSALAQSAELNAPKIAVTTGYNVKNAIKTIVRNTKNTRPALTRLSIG